MASHASDIWTGEWKWNAQTARYSDPLHPEGAIAAQSMAVIARGIERLEIRTDHEYADGSRRSWRYVGAFDGRPYPIRWIDNGDLMATITFGLMSEQIGTDGFISAGEPQFRGAEFFVITETRVESTGFIAIGDSHYPYWEEWTRMA